MPRHAVISGAGIAGPALAHQLTARGWSTTVLERFPQRRDEGQNVDIRGEAREVVRRLADNGICALGDLPNRALSRMGADDFGGAVTIGLAPYSTPYEVDHLVRTLGSLG